MPSCDTFAALPTQSCGWPARAPVVFEYPCVPIVRVEIPDATVAVARIVVVIGIGIVSSVRHASPSHAPPSVANVIIHHIHRIIHHQRHSESKSRVRASTVHEDETRHERIVFEGVKTKPKAEAITSHIQRFMTHHIPPITSLNPPGHPPALVRADLVLSPVHRPGPGDVKTNDRETWGERAARGGRWDGPGPSRANVGDDGGEGEGGGGDGGGGECCCIFSYMFQPAMVDR